MCPAVHCPLLRHLSLFDVCALLAVVPLTWMFVGTWPIVAAW
jgi:hypothetical protein